MLSLPSASPSPPATAARDAVLGALVSGALLPADVAGLPGAVAIVAALCGVRGGVRLPVAVAALRAAGHHEAAAGLPAAAQGRVRRPKAIEAVAEMRAQCAGEVARDEQGGREGDGREGGDGGSQGGVGGVAAGVAEGRAIALAIPDPVEQGVAMGGPGDAATDVRATGGPCPPERAAELPAAEAPEGDPDDALTPWAPVPALAPANPLAPWSPAPDPALTALLSRLRAATTRPGASCDGRAGKGPRCGRCIRCKREVPQRSPAAAWLRTWRG